MIQKEEKTMLVHTRVHGEGTNRMSGNANVVAVVI
jgi:hypothetical protein